MYDEPGPMLLAYSGRVKSTASTGLDAQDGVGLCIRRRYHYGGMPLKRAGQTYL